MARGIRVIKQKRTQYNAPVGLIKQDNAVEKALMGVAQQSYKVAQLGFQEMAKESVDVAKQRAMSVPLERLTTLDEDCLLYTSPSPRDRTRSRMPSSA